MRITMGIRKRNLVKERTNTGSNARVANRRRKGVSTIIGITIFLLIFAIAISYTFAWTQNTGSYLQTVNQQVDLDRLKIGENLVVSAINTTTLTVTNPTGNPIVVTQIWSGVFSGAAYIPVWSGLQGISGFGNLTFITNATNGNGQYKVVTLRGNIFSGGLQSQLAAATQRAWQVNWYYNNVISPPIDPPQYPANFTSNNLVGQSYWYDLNLAWDWTAFNNPVIGGNYNITSNVTIGFIATTSVIKLSDSNSNATVNFFIDNSSAVAIGVDGSVPNWWSTSANITETSYSSTLVNITGVQNSVHTLTVYFYSNGTSDTELKLNIVNATLR